MVESTPCLARQHALSWHTAQNVSAYSTQCLGIQHTMSRPAYMQCWLSLALTSSSNQTKSNDSLWGTWSYSIMTSCFVIVCLHKCHKRSIQTLTIQSAIILYESIIIPSSSHYYFHTCRVPAPRLWHSVFGSVSSSSSMTPRKTLILNPDSLGAILEPDKDRTWHPRSTFGWFS